MAYITEIRTDNNKIEIIRYYCSRIKRKAHQIDGLKTTNK